MLLPFQAFVIRRLFSSIQYKPPLFHYEDIIEFACSWDDCSSQRARRYLNLRWESARAKTSILRAGLRNVFTCISFGIIFLADIIFRMIYLAAKTAVLWIIYLGFRLSLTSFLGSCSWLASSSGLMSLLATLPLCSLDVGIGGNWVNSLAFSSSLPSEHFPCPPS